MKIRKEIANLRKYIPFYREILHIREILFNIQTEIYKLRGQVSQLQSMQVIKFYEIELKKHPRYSDPRRLQLYEAQVNSQGGEDGIIQEIFRRIGFSNRVFVEIGVGDGSENNTAFLLSQGWTGYWLDGNDAFLQTIKFRKDLNNGCIKYCVSFVTVDNAIQLFEQLDIPKEFDLLSIDVDHNTYYLWDALGKYQPRVVVVEYNAAIPPEIDWKVHYDAYRLWDESQNFGASLKAFELLAQKFGYSLVGCNFAGINAFFVRNDLISDQFANPFTAENHHEPPRYVFAQRWGHQKAVLDRQGVD